MTISNFYSNLKNELNDEKKNDNIREHIDDMIVFNFIREDIFGSETKPSQSSHVKSAEINPCENDQQQRKNTIDIIIPSVTAETETSGIQFTHTNE